MKHCIFKITLQASYKIDLCIQYYYVLPASQIHAMQSYIAQRIMYIIMIILQSEVQTQNRVVQ